MHTQRRAVAAAIGAATAEEGRTTLRALADAAGLTDSGLLHHFGSRDGLLLAAAREVIGSATGTKLQRAALARELVRIACDRNSPAQAEALAELTRYRSEGGTAQLGVILEAAISAAAVNTARGRMMDDEPRR